MTLRSLGLIALVILVGACGDDGPSRDEDVASRPLTYEEAQTLNNRGTVLMDRNEVEDALVVYEELVRRAPASRDARQNLAVCLLNAEHKVRKIRNARFDRCEEILRGLVEEFPEFPNAHYTLGILLEHRGREFTEVLSLYRRAQELAPEDPDAAYRYGKALYSADEPDYEKSLVMLRRAVEREPHFKSAWNSLYPTLRRLGRKEEARAAIESFKVYDSFKPDLGRLLKLVYNSMGTLANVVRKLAPWPGVTVPDAPAPLELVLSHAGDAKGSTEAVAESLLRRGHRVPAGTDLRRFIEENVTPFLAGGIAMHDIDGDGRPEFFVTDGKGPGRLFTRTKNGLADISAEWGLTEGPRAVGGVFGDVDHDGRPDLFVYGCGPDVLYLNAGKRFEKTDHCRGDDSLTAAAIMVDADHDGDIDIFTAGYMALPELGRTATEELTFPEDFAGAANHLHNNDRPTLYSAKGEGADAFHDIAEATGLRGNGERTVDAAAFDLDRDGDVDLVLANDGSPDRVYLNDRLWNYREVAAELGLDDAGPAGGLAVCDVDQDGRLDWFVSRGDGLSTTLVRNPHGEPPRADSTWARNVPEAARAAHVHPADLDNDGDPDLILCPGGDQAATVLRNDGETFSPAGELQGSAGLRATLPIDLDGDGLLDLLGAIPGEGRLERFENGTRGDHAWVRLDLRGKSVKGLADMWSNHFGVGTFVEAAHGSHRTFADSGVGGGRGVQAPPHVHIGLGTAGRIDSMRLLWPDLVLQAEGNLQVRKVHEIEEVNRKSSSCPIVYTRNADGGFDFVTDFLGVGGLGFFLTPDAYAQPDSTEVVRIGNIAPHEGKLSLRVVEPMEEICYLDRLTLMVVEHDEDVTVHCDERLATAEPMPTGRPIAFHERHVATRATNAAGDDVTEALRAQDRDHAPGVIVDRRFVGYLAEEQRLTLEIDADALARSRPSDGSRLWCLVDGWVEYPYSHVNFAAWQAGLSGESFSLDVETSDGWKTAMPHFGYPAGMTRTMAVDVTDALTPVPSRVRLRTNLHINVDRISFVWELPADAVEVSRHAFDSAELRWLGYPAEVTPDGKQPTIYAYDQIVEDMSWKTMGGNYSAYGDVLDRLAEADDRLVIMNHGEEIALDLEAAKLPALAAGRVRTFFLESVGWCKDMDPYTATPDTVEPIPWHGMGSYPPGEATRGSGSGTRRLQSTLPLAPSSQSTK